MKLRLLALPLIMLSSPFARAEPLDDKTVTADAKWVLHLDADAMVKTQTWKLIEPKLQQNPEFVKGVANLERIFAAKFPADLHGITLYGPSFDPKSAVVVVQASIDQERMKTLLSVNETYTTQTLGGYTIHGWIDKGKQLYGGFAEGNRLIIGQTPERIAAALDVIGGKSEALKGETLLGGEKNAGVIAYVAGTELAKLAEMKIARNPIVGKLQSAWISGAEDQTGLQLKAHVVADDATVAQNIAKSVDGLKAALSFAEQDDTDAALFATAADGLTAKADGNSVDATLSLPIQVLGNLIDRKMAKGQN